MTVKLHRDGLYRLLYTSTIAQNAGHEGEEIDPVSIAVAASDNNRRNGVTGSLLYVDGQFIQILEGAAADVEATFERICRDFRHRDLHLIDLVNVPTRIFPEWGMACLAPDETTQLALRDEIEEICFMVGVNAGQAVLQMRALLNREALAA